MRYCRLKLTTLLIVTVLSLNSNFAIAQEQINTVRYTTQEAEQLFLENNLPLLAERLNISQADAKILQAKAWPNPRFTLEEVQLYVNSTTDDIPPLFGNFWRNRNFGAQLEQLVYTAGKRKKNVALETRNKELAQSAFTDLLQALKAEFRQTAAEIQYIQRVQDDWDLQLKEVEKLLKAQQSQLREGNISQAELYRLKALQISLKGEINGLHEQMTEKQKTLKTLMYIDPNSFIVITDVMNDADVFKLKQHTLNRLISFSDNNAALQGTRNEVKVNEAQLAVERANSVPDISFNISYDRNGSVMRDFVGVGFSMDLPIFNRNKGNINSAKLEVQKSMLMEKNKVSDLNNSIVKTWLDMNKSIELYEAIDKDYVQKLDQMTKAIASNFSNHNISLLEFLDFFESFRESKEKYYEAIKNILLKKEDLNYLTGTEL